MAGGVITVSAAVARPVLLGLVGWAVIVIFIRTVDVVAMLPTEAAKTASLFIIKGRVIEHVAMAVLEMTL